MAKNTNTKKGSAVIILAIIYGCTGFPSPADDQISWGRRFVGIHLKFTSKITVGGWNLLRVVTQWSALPVCYSHTFIVPCLNYSPSLGVKLHTATPIPIIAKYQSYLSWKTFWTKQVHLSVFIIFISCYFTILLKLAIIISGELKFIFIFCYSYEGKGTSVDIVGSEIFVILTMSF